MKIQFTTDLLIFDENENHIWLSDIWPDVLDEPVEIDDIYYIDGELDGRLTIDDIMYSFDLEGIFDDDEDISFFEFIKI